MATKQTSGSTPAGKPLEILIAGAGIGGLAAAVGLRQQGHNVTLFERSALAKEIGAAMHIAPNCTALLSHMDIDPSKYGSVEMYGMNTYSASGELLSSRDSREDNKKYPHTWWLMHRAHVHTALKDKALPIEGPGRPVKIETRAQVTSIDPKLATITTVDGRTHKGDLVIGADGVHSQARKHIPGCNLQPFDSGKSAFRCLIPMKTIAESKLHEILDYNQYFYIWVGKDRRIVMYPCASNTQMNVAVLFPSELLPSTDEANLWQRPGRKSDLLDICKDFDPRVLDALDRVDESELKTWTLLDLEKVPRFWHENLVLLGDAAHPFLPRKWPCPIINNILLTDHSSLDQAQGGAQAIEDGASIAAVFPLGTTAEDIPARLKLYEAQRYERAHKIQEFTRLTGQDLVDDKIHLKFHDFVDYNVNHDEWQASTTALQKHLAHVEV
jgi:2-polyprenyl-6-methoxyphenol hydroxylase-like FAD-dependent oxidoreductase